MYRLVISNEARVELWGMVFLLCLVTSIHLTILVTTLAR